MPRPSTSIAMSTRNILAAALLLGLFAGGAAIADDTWPVHGKLQGKNGKKSKDMSGIACTAPQDFPRACLVIDDNLQAAQFVTVQDGEIQAGDMMPLIDNRFKGKALELDGEGVAYADGFFYVIGSHGRPRDSEHKFEKPKHRKKLAARIEASSQIVRFRPEGAHKLSAVEKQGKLRAIIEREPALSKYLDSRLEDNGLTIEGIAVRHGRILAGFRGPSLAEGRAAVLSVAVDAIFGNATASPHLYRLPLGKGQGIRDLAVFGDGVLVLAGPTASDPGQYAIYWWDGESDDAKLLKDLADVVGKKGKRKAEALLPLDETPSGLRVLILFDSEKEGAPVTVTIPRP
jgi:hypothetical protein